ncbi:hypothetical protein [Rhodococcus sp. MS13]|uniref:hypothetical protein n=1 Tax=Rhodococcus sp. MS13 TaxID=2579940 RepID=UPI001561C0BA|nr:hypothetical protein [Rhodococcus sp. MS13]NRH35831.1 hypothetical protein [Rhodococcus sp. MS13]
MAKSDSQSVLPWSFGHKRFGNDELPGHLLEISNYHARAAISESTSTDARRWLNSAVHAGSAIEIFAKFLLARENPTLILEMKNASDLSLLHTIGRSDVGNTDDAMNLQTRGPDSCFKLIAVIWGSDKVNQGCARRVLNARNAAIHLGLLDRAQLQEALIEFADVMTEMLRLAKVDEAGFWKSSQVRVERLSSDRSLHRRLKIKLAESDRCAATLGPVDEGAVRLEMRRATEPSDLQDTMPDSSVFMRSQCPGCGRVGRTYYSTSESAPEREFDGPLMIPTVASPVGFRCTTCNLALSLDELNQLNMAGGFELAAREATDEEITKFDAHLEEMYAQDRRDHEQGR